MRWILSHQDASVTRTLARDGLPLTKFTQLDPSDLGCGRNPLFGLYFALFDNEAESRGFPTQFTHECTRIVHNLLTSCAEGLTKEAA